MAWTVAAVLTVVACIVFMASGGGKAVPPAAWERPVRDVAPQRTQKPGKAQTAPPLTVASAPQKNVTAPSPKSSELEVARKRLEELAKTYLPQAPAYREQMARVQALETIEREHADESRELKKARVDLAVAIARGLGEAHPKVIEMKARIEELEKRARAGE